MQTQTPYQSCGSEMAWYNDILVTGDSEWLKEKLLSIPGHISNEHHFPDNTKYKDCPHGPLEKAWLPAGSLVSMDYISS